MALPNSWISALFKKFQIIFGSKWSSQISGMENEYIAEWAEGLKALTGKHIKYGLQKCRSLEWPPSMAEFVVLCAGVQKPKIHGAAYTDYKSLPKPKREVQSIK